MKNKFNTLHKYIFENSVKEYHKETLLGLFRAILEPVIQDQNLDACILFKLNDISEKEAIVKRLCFSNSAIFSYSDCLADYGYENIQVDEIWNTTEFVLINGSKYSAALIWDYSLSSKQDFTPVCFMYNSKIIGDIAKKIAENSRFDIREIVLKYTPDRRENRLLNKSINILAEKYNDLYEEILYNELEKTHLATQDDTIQVAQAVSDKAKFIAHEIKNNLSIINLYSTIIDKRIENITVDKEILESLKTAIKNVTNASENVSVLINDLRGLSAVYKTEFDLKELLLSVVMQCSQKAQQSDVKLEIQKIPDCKLFSDRTKIQSVVMNLIYNALEACNVGSCVNIDCKKTAKNVKIIVKNNGEKIPVELQEKIFDADFTTKSTGSGLGLNLCRSQIQLLDGSINLVSSNDDETIFEVLLPV